MIAFISEWFLDVWHHGCPLDADNGGHGSNGRTSAGLRPPDGDGCRKTVHLHLWGPSVDLVNYAMLQWNLSWEATTMRDHLSWRTISFWQKVPHFTVNEPVTEDHLSWETIFLWPMGWSFMTGSTVLQWNLYIKTTLGTNEIWSLYTAGLYMQVQ